MNQEVTIPQICDWMIDFVTGIDGEVVNSYTFMDGEDNSIIIINDETEEEYNIYSAIIDALGTVQTFDESGNPVCSIDFYGRCDPRTYVSC